MKGIPTAPPLPNTPPTQDFRKLGFVYITVLGLANQVVPHTGSWRPLATAINYLVCTAPIVYMALQAQPASPVGVQPDSGMGRDSCSQAHAHDEAANPLPSPGVTVKNQMVGIVRPRKTRNQQRTATKPLREIDNLNAVIDKKWVKAGVAQITMENLDLPYFYPNNYEINITHYTLAGDGSA
ncbi:hypothetical protein DSO57_1025630 [Entomophthora muscae]|uniref:Uncharacterized protein n=1 Tax=Entomophthora muscae TaxID=34485 RepID=A0ACC2UMX1_9FUNG|nr:hypothetical protein DSO57_1025630 [Entomophthora muscae]